MSGIKVDLSGVRKKLSTENFERGQFNMASRMHSTMNENFVPEKDGDLRKMSNVAPDGSQIEWISVYARRQFYAPGGWNYTTPGTGPRWDLKAEPIFMSDWIKAFKKGAGL
ncbi:MULTISPECIES: minor capsid protein [unclassified Enterococcus]|jgi:hypothetical protein|uniref:minor capsid protein n=1 Tax=unclassified Enterococcus TaxID=2608891 RepID=UPI003F29596A